VITRLVFHHSVGIGSYSFISDSKIKSFEILDSDGESGFADRAMEYCAMENLVITGTVSAGNAFSGVNTIRFVNLPDQENIDSVFSTGPLETYNCPNAKTIADNSFA
jgi:hypothetical protein